MANKNFACFFVYKVLLPSALLTAAVSRYNGVSFMCLVCLLVIPILPTPSSQSPSRVTSVFLKALVVLSTLVVVAHAVFHITLFSKSTNSKPYGSIFPNCSGSEKLARQIGFQRLDGIPLGHILRLILPDIFVCIVSILVLVVSKKGINESKGMEQTPTSSKRQGKTLSVVDFIGEFFVGLGLAASGIMAPSIFSSVYFVTFLVMAVLWACYVSLNVRFCVFLSLYMATHVTILYLFQLQFFQEMLPKDTAAARLLGLTGVFKIDCSKLYSLEFDVDSRWWHLANLWILPGLYWILVHQTHHWKRVEKETKCSNRKITGSIQRESPSVGNIPEHQGLVQALSPRGLFRLFQKSPSPSGENDVLVEASYRNINYSASSRAQSVSQMPRVARWSRKITSSLFGTDTRKRAPLVSVFVFAMNKSHDFMLLSMIAWSVMYVSWLTFVLLLGACVLWMLPDTRRASLSVSPFLVLYVIGLVAAQYIFNMNLPFELPTQVGSIPVSEIGLKRFDSPPKDLAIHLALMMCSLLTFRQYIQRLKLTWKTQPHRIRNRIIGRLMQHMQQSERRESVQGYDSATVLLIGRTIILLMRRYFIVVCAGALLVTSVQEVIIFRIIYMALFLLFVICFQISYRLWRALMLAFWWMVIVYSMIVIIILYTYQFELFTDLWRKSTGLGDKALHDLGLKKISGKDLLVCMLTPTSLLVAITIQVKYFHNGFLQISDLDRDVDSLEETLEKPETRDKCIEEAKINDQDPSYVKSKWHVRVIRCVSRWRLHILFANYYRIVTTSLWRIAEIHMFKVVVIVTMYVALRHDEVSALTAVYVILICLILPLSLRHTQLNLLLSHLIVIWTGLIILMKMMFQLESVPPFWNNIGCNRTTKWSSEQYGNKSMPLMWFGLKKITLSDTKLDQYIAYYIIILVVVIFESIVRYHQTLYYKNPQVAKPTEGIMFNGVVRADADKGLLLCMKFFVNYTFYKFGLEICYVTTMVTVVIRQDAFGAIYAALLGIVVLMSRKMSCRVWWLYLIVLALLLPVQFLSMVGLPPVSNFCDAYPWSTESRRTSAVGRWFLFPDFTFTPTSYLLMADLMQLLMVAMQLKVFKLEQSPVDYGGGSNADILPDVEAFQEIPVEDFTITTTGYLDICKQIVFEYMYWLTLTLLLFAGISRVDIFYFVSVIAVFYYTFYIRQFILKTLRQQLRIWNMFIAYMVFETFAKSCLQLIGCIYPTASQGEYSWVTKALEMHCTLSDVSNNQRYNAEYLMRSDDFRVLELISFAMLLLQRRICGSHYFRHVVDLFSAYNNVSSKGSAIIRKIWMHKVRKRKEQEMQCLAHIKKKMKIFTERRASAGFGQHMSRKKGALDGVFDSVKSEQQSRSIFQLFNYQDYVDDQKSVDSADSDYNDGLCNRTENILAGDNMADKNMDGKANSGASSNPLETIHAASVNLGTRLSDDHNTLDVITADSETTQKGGRDEGNPLDVISSAMNQVKISHPDIEGSTSSRGLLTADSLKQNASMGLFDNLSNRSTDSLNTLETTTNMLSLISLTKLTKDPEPQSTSFDRAKLDHDKSASQKIYTPQQSTQSTLPQGNNALSKDNTRSNNGDSSSRKHFIDWIICKCNKYSFSYRLVSRELERHTCLEKKKRALERARFRLSAKQSDETHLGLVGLVGWIRNFPSRNVTKPDALILSWDELLDEGGKHVLDEGQPRRLIVAIGYLFVSWTELVCYFLMVLNHALNASLLSMPLPFFAFLWGMLSIPRPTRAFWLTVITYTQAMVAAKYLFQFDIFPWNDGSVDDSPFFPPRILGIEKNDYFAHMDIVLLLALLLHCSILRKYGMWRHVQTKKKHEQSSTLDSTQTYGRASSFQPAGTTNPETEEMSDSAESEDSDRDRKKTFKEAYLHAVAPVHSFVRKVTAGGYNVAVNVYSFIFFCDFVNFFVIGIGYNGFGPAVGKESASIASYMDENKVPLPFLAISIVQFLMMLVDRALFLRKHVFGKVMFQVFQMIGVHIWLFFVVPSSTKILFKNNPWAQTWYFVKCAYFALSAYQIRCGYPTLGSSQVRNYGLLNYSFQRGMTFVPFLWELCSLVDWSFTESALDVMSWFQMEDIYNSLFALKCETEFKVSNPRVYAQQTRAAFKYIVGGVGVFLIVLVIWSPMVLFSISSAINAPNPPLEVTVVLQVGVYQPLFKVTVQNDIKQITSPERKQLISQFRLNRRETAWFGEFQEEDVTVIHFAGQSMSLWAISEPGQTAMIKDLYIDDSNTTYRSEVQFTITAIRELERVEKTFKTVLDGETMRNISLLVSGNTFNDTVISSVKISNVFPRFLEFTSNGIRTANPIIDTFGYDTIQIQLGGNRNVSNPNKFWTIEQRIYNDNHFETNTSKPFNFTSSIKLISFNSRQATPTFSFLRGIGIFGFYMSFIFVIGTYLRSLVFNRYVTIIYHELPEVDNILQLSLDVYLVREMREFTMEHDLYEKLIFLYRSPETIIKVSQPKLKQD